MAKCKYCDGLGYYFDEVADGDPIKTVCMFCQGSQQSPWDEEFDNLLGGAENESSSSEMS